MRLRHICALVLILSLITGSIFADARVRKVSVVKDQIVTVKTALGVATIIQVPDKPNSVVVGDMNAFKVEYLDTAITIKPLTTHAKSNLYIYTDYRRFNVQLVSGSEAAADYVVYLENPVEKEKFAKTKPEGSGITWKRVNRSFKNENASFGLNRIGTTKSGVAIIEFTLSSTKREQINPAWFWVTQGGVTRPIQNLFLSDVKMSPGQKIQGSIQLLKADFSSDPIRIEMRRKKTTYLTLKEFGA